MYLIENLPPAMWSRAVPGVPRRTVRMIAAHIHNVRCMWIKMMGAKHGIAIPRTVDPRRVRASELLRALSRSSDATASSDCSNSALLEVARFLGLRGRTSRPISCTFSTTSWRTRPTIVASCAWRARWGNGYQGGLRRGSGHGRSEHENEADAAQAVGADERGLAGLSRARSSTAVSAR
jgi:hypothetical protein